MADGLTSAFEGAVDEGRERVRRGLPSLLATGAVGGIDVSLGVFALLLVSHRSGSDLLGSLAFTIGFIAITLANSELFTENFLVPVVSVAAGDARWRDIVRLWVGTASTNLLGGWVLMVVLVTGFPVLRELAGDRGGHFIELGIGMQSFATAVLAGTIITLMTWMQRGSPTTGGRIVAAIAAGFLLSYGQFNHAVVASIEMFAALIVGAEFGYADWFPIFLWAALGNMVGGIGLVTVLRLLQVGPDKLREERLRDPDRDPPRESGEEAAARPDVDQESTGRRPPERAPA